MMFSRFIRVGKGIKTQFFSKSFATTVYLSIKQLLDIWVVSIWGLLW